MSLITELKRRNVIKVAVTYAVVAWLTVQVSETIQPLMSLPEWAPSFVLFALIIGFPIAVLFAWAFEMTPEGVKRTKEVDKSASITDVTGRKLDFIMIGALVLIIVGMGVERFFFASGDSDMEAVSSEKVSIAVLPFADMSEKGDQEYFTDGISEELLNVLARVPELHVAARTSSFAFKGQNKDIRDIADLLDVDHVLEGSIRKSGTTLRITAQLIDASNNYHMWSETYDRELTDVFAVQDEIAAAILDAMKIHLLGEEEVSAVTVSTTANTLAYEQYLIGRNLIIKRTRLDIEAAVDYLKNSILQDANYAPAQAWLSLAYILLENSNSTYGELSNPEMIALATPPITRALALEPDNAEVHAIYGLLQANSSIDGVNEDRFNEAALASYNKAIALNPNLAMAYTWKSILLQDMEDAEGAFKAQEAAYRLDPLSILSGGNMVAAYLREERYDDGLAVLDKLEKVHVRASRLPELRATLNALLGDQEGAIKQYYKALKFEPSDLRVQGRISDLYSSVGLYERALKFADIFDKIEIASDQDEHQKAYDLVQKILAKNPNAEWAHSWAAFLAYDAGDTERAVELAEKAEKILISNNVTDCQNSIIHAWEHMGMPERAERWDVFCKSEFAERKADIEAGDHDVHNDDVLWAFRSGEDSMASAWMTQMFERLHKTNSVFVMDNMHAEYAHLASRPSWQSQRVKMNAKAAEVKALYLLLEKRGEIPNPLGKD